MDNIIKRGDIFYADLRAMQRGRRPVVIIQNDIANKYSSMVIAIAITTGKGHKMPTHIELSLEEYGLMENSVIMVEQIFSLDKNMLEHKIGSVSEDILNKIEIALDISLGRKSIVYIEEDKKYYIDQLSKPLIITEGKTDVVLIETAWGKLYPDTEMFFECEASGIEFEKEKRVGCANNVRRKIEFLSNTLERPIIGLFDNDRDGNEHYKSLSKVIFEEANIRNDLRKHYNKNIWGMLLPVPDERKQFVTSDDLTQRYFVIEHYFSDEILKKHNMYGNNILGTSVFKVKDRKDKFAKEVSNLETKEFENFRILFNKIKEVLNAI